MKRAQILTVIVGSILFFSIQLKAQQPADTTSRITIAGLDKGYVLKSTLLSTKGIECTNKEYEIISFTLLVTKDQNDLEETSNVKAFTDRMLNLLKEMKQGDVIIIKDVKAKTKNGSTVELQSLILKLK